MLSYLSDYLIIAYLILLQFFFFFFLVTLKHEITSLVYNIM